ncbi:TAXI family TRAP transporter solute-binding subunit [Macrococcoides bohemicum]|nr:TAXI family TRAP transporter solute-binding subunit [Macrococcus bohemicus]TDL35600.1 TAXI family TRAP transporter solute-binding subunit [Macrococcus bohemicus]
MIVIQLIKRGIFVKRVISICMVAIMCLSLSACNFEKKKVYNIATASTGGTYYPIGVGMGQLWTKYYKEKNMKFNGTSSAGSVENIDLMKKGEAEFAILQGLISTMASEGSGIYEGQPYKDLRSIAMIWPNVEHFVLMDSKIQSGTISDIKGKSFSVGPRASGTEISTVTMMEGLKLTKKNIRAEYLGYDDTISAMRDGRLDGGSLPAGVPVSAITDMTASGVKASILEVSEEQLKSINEVSESWYPYTIKKGTYPKQKKDIQTIAQPNILVTTNKMSEKQVYNMTKILYDNKKFMDGVHNSAKEMKLETALDGLKTPLHPGAYKYFKEKGLNIPEKLIPPEVKKGDA